MYPIYQKIHNYVACYNLCQKTIAMEAGMTQAKLSQLLHGKRRLTMDDYVRICAAIGRDPRFFFEPNERLEQCD